MSRTRWLLAAVTLLIVGSVLRAGNTSGEKTGMETDPKLAFIKIGAHYINGNRITHVVSGHDQMRIMFGEGLEDSITLNGSQAEALRQWLDSRALTVRSTGKDGPQRKQIFSPTHPPDGRTTSRPNRPGE